MIAGAATCFYALVGFDTIAASGEESTQPTKHVPIAIVSTLAICLVSYLGVGSILTLLVPWNKLADTAALPKAFAQVCVFVCLLLKSNLDSRIRFMDCSGIEFCGYVSIGPAVINLLQDTVW